MFGRYKVAEYARCLGASFMPWGTLGASKTRDGSLFEPFMIVVDSGYSSTHAIPILNGRPAISNIKRLDVGGKLLTNLLKETISYRHYNMMDETFLINDIKEQCCFVSTNFAADIERAKAGLLKVDFVLPDNTTDTVGFLATEDTIITDEMQILSLSNELFTIPEILFRPSNLGLSQAGIAELVMQALHGLPEEVQALCLANTILTGGNAKFAGFKQRFTDELRSIAPDQFDVEVKMPDDPITYAAECGARMSSQTTYMIDKFVSRAQYKTEGKQATQQFTRFYHESDREFEQSRAVRPESPLRKYAESDRPDTPRSVSPDSTDGSQ